MYLSCSSHGYTFMDIFITLLLTEIPLESRTCTTLVSFAYLSTASAPTKKNYRSRIAVIDQANLPYFVIWTPI